MARSADPVLAQRRRRQILDAAIACFRRRGFHQASMHEICAEAGLSAGALYRYFPSKADIIAAMADEHGREFDALIGDVATGPDGPAALAALAERAVARCADDAPLVAEVLAEAMRDRAVADRFAEREVLVRESLARAIRAAQRRGALSPRLAPEQAAGIVILMLDGLVLRAAAVGAARARPLVDDFRVAMAHLFAPGAPSRLSVAETER
jgi:AcrR family transcriptional regulator